MKKTLSGLGALLTLAVVSACIPLFTPGWISQGLIIFLLLIVILLINHKTDDDGQEI